MAYKFVDASSNSGSGVVSTKSKYKFVDTAPKKETDEDKARKIIEASKNSHVGQDIVSSIGKQISNTPLSKQPSTLAEKALQFTKNVTEPWISAATGAENALFGNLLDNSINWWYPSVAKEQKQATVNYPKMNIAGQVVGTVAPFGAASKLATVGLKGAGILAQGASAAAKIKNAIAIETAAGAGLGAIEGLVKGEGAKGALEKASEYGGLGALGAGVFEGLGIGAKAALKTPLGQSAISSTKDLFSKSGESVSKALENIKGSLGKKPIAESVEAAPMTTKAAASADDAVANIKEMLAKTSTTTKTPTKLTAADEFMQKANTSINQNLSSKGNVVDMPSSSQEAADRIKQRLTNERMGTPSVQEAQQLYGRSSSTMDEAVNNIKAKLSGVEPKAQTKMPLSNSSQIDVDGIKSIDDLPNTEDGLKRYIAKAQEAKDRGIKINLQLFAEAESMLKERRFISNSIMNSKIVPDEIKANLKRDMPKYEQVSNVGTFQKAKASVDYDYEGMLNQYRSLKSLRSADDTALGEALIKKAIDFGDNKEATSLMVDLAEKLTSSGQATQAAAIFKKLTPEGMLMNAQKQINKAAREIKLAKPEIEQQFSKEVKLTKEAVSQAKQDVVASIQKDLSGLDSTLTDTTQQKLKDLKLSADKVAKEYYSNFDDSTIKLVDYIKNRTKLTGEDLDSLTGLIENKYKESLKNKVIDLVEKKLTPKTGKIQKDFINNMLENVNSGTLDDNAISEAIAKKVGLPYLGQQDANGIINVMKEAAKLPDGRQKDIAIAQAMKIIANNIPTDMVGKIKGLQRVNLLFNIKTMIRNILGNAAQAGIGTAKDIVRAPIDAAISKVFNTSRTVAMPNIKAQIKGFTRGLKDSIEDYRLGIDTFQPGGQYELPAGQTFKSKLLNKVDELTRFGLSIGDRPFYQAAYEDSLAQSMKVAKVKTPTTDMINDAIKVADERTYRDINSFTESFRKIRDGLNLGKKFGVGNLAIPFYMTPANILKSAIEYSPVSIASAIKEATNVAKGTFNQKRFVDLVAKGATGTVGLVWGGYELAKKGLITGAPSEDTDMAAFERDAGRNSYAFKIGDSTFTYDWAQPGSIGLAIGADMFLRGKNKDAVDKTLMDAISSGGKTLFQQSLLQGLQKMFGGYNPVDNIQDVLLSSATQFVPLGSALKTITQFLDDTARSNYSASPIQSKAINPTLAKIPGASQTLEPKITTLGEEAKIYQGKNNFFNILINPGFYSKENSDPVSKEILRIYDETGETVQVPRVATKSFTVENKATKKKDTYNLTPKQYTEYQTLLGQETKKRFEAIISSGQYKAVNNQTKTKLLQDGLDSVNKRVKNVMLAKVKEEANK